MTPRRRTTTRRTLAAVVVIGVLSAGCGQGGNVSTVDVVGTTTPAPTGSVVDGEVVFTIDGVPDVVATVASGLDTPWGWCSPRPGSAGRGPAARGVGPG